MLVRYLCANVTSVRNCYKARPETTSDQGIVNTLLSLVEPHWGTFPSIDLQLFYNIPPTYKAIIAEAGELHQELSSVYFPRPMS